MTLRFLLDEDVSARVAIGLRDRGIDAISVHEIGRVTLSDSDQLTFAAEAGRVLVTYNRADFQNLDAEWHQEERTHAGILWGSDQSIRRRAYGELIRALEYNAHLYDSLASLCLPIGHPVDH